MLAGLVLKKIIGSKNDRELKKILPAIQAINQMEPQIRVLSDKALQAKTAELKQKLANGATLDDILVEAFAVCREAAIRVLGQRHYDVQLVGGYALHKGMISEMKTGEGKTLVSTLASYLNGLSGKGVHIITVNDYLAKRDAEWMGRVHRFLGLEVGCILNNMNDRERKIQYNSDITYGTNNEFGFDYLRDNMKPSLDRYVQREHNFAIIDEVDSILIDEARTPLIISGPTDESTDLYYDTDRAIKLLKRDIDYTMDEKHRSVTLTEDGVRRIEEILNIENLYSPDNASLVHHVHAGLKAHALFKRDTDYVVRDGEIVIVDEFTGRFMPGRRWSDGIHQAIEAKEGVTIEGENQTLATITLQNYFRLYSKLSGMTGTADTEAAEFKKIYNLEVLVIPTNRPNYRDDFQDLVYRNEAGKYRAVIEDIKEKHTAGRPVLVGTVSVAKSERVSKLLLREGIPHNILNAKNHASEAEIISDAGLNGAVTIATNMAGRGTDIILGAGVKDVGGLHVIATERHESRRIDNQLRGRAGRQGDPGSSQFYLSLEDDLMRIFASDRMVTIMDKLGMEEDVPISDRLVSKSIENAQKRVEMHHFDQREHLLKYDDVLNKQREVIYNMRRLVLEGKETKGLVRDLSKEFAADIVAQFEPDRRAGETWNFDSLLEALRTAFNFEDKNKYLKQLQELNDRGITSAILVEWITKEAHNIYLEREKIYGEETVRELEKYFFLQSIDHHWKEHLLALDHLKEGIHLRGYAQKDPLVEYRREGFYLFKMLDRVIRQTALSRLFTARILSQAERDALRRREEEEALRKINAAELNHPEAVLEGGSTQGNPNIIEEREDAAPAPSAPNPALQAAVSFMKKYEAEKVRQLQTATAGAGNVGGASAGAAEAPTAPIKSTEPKIGRNDPCFCGSGKKYKQCHGKNS
ncbi:MAG: preprotein translocase subunit SecA [Bdellovibrionota bacterium]